MQAVAVNGNSGAGPGPDSSTEIGGLHLNLPGQYGAVEKDNSFEDDLLHPSFERLMNLQHELGDTNGHHIVHSLQQHSHAMNAVRRPISGEFRLHITPATATEGVVVTQRDPVMGPVDLLELSFETKRRLLHFLYAADQPLSLRQFSILPAINTMKRCFERERILPLAAGTAQQYLTCWFGDGIVFNAVQQSVYICDEGRVQGASWFVRNFPRVFISSEEAHAETLYVCGTYLLFSSGGYETKGRDGMGFQFSDENNLDQVMEELRVGPQGPAHSSFGYPQPEASTPSEQRHITPAPAPGNIIESAFFYCLLEYATLNWPRHLAYITPLGTEANNLSEGVSLSVLRIVAFVLSFQFLTWLESLNNILRGSDQNNSEAIALAQAHVFGTFKRWVQASSFQHENPTDVKLFSRALHWLSILHSVDILDQVQAATEGPFSSSSRKTKSAICQALQERFTTLGHFEQVSQHECEAIANTKFDAGYWKYVMRLISGAREPCVVDLSRRLAFYVQQNSWSGGALHFECVDLETGLILGRDSVWCKRFFGWKQRVIIAKSATHIGLQVVAQKQNGDQVQNLLLTYVWDVKGLERIKLGEGILGERWMIDNESQTIQTRDLAAGQSHSDLYQQGQLTFGSDGATVTTPSGTWNLQGRTKHGDCTIEPTMLAVSANGASEAHAELDIRGNKCIILLLKTNPSPTIQSFLPHLMLPIRQPGGLNAYLPAMMVDIRYAAFSRCGTNFLLQTESPSALEPERKELIWSLYMWEHKNREWVLQNRHVTDEDEFWPLQNQEELQRCGFESICSVQKVVEGAL